MAQLNKADLEQMGEEYFRSLEPESLVEVAKNLHSKRRRTTRKTRTLLKNQFSSPLIR